MTISAVGEIGAGVTVCCVADFDHNGTLAMADLFAFLSAWMAGAPNTDFDRSGSLSVADVVAFISAWSNGC